MSFHDTLNPSGEVPMERVVDRSTPEQHLLERILATENMELAWKRVRANKGAPGVDGITIDDFPDRFRPLWADIRASLNAGTYQPKPVLRVEIPKPTGGTRPLGIPTVLDRLIQQSIAQVLTPIFDPEFSASSFGFRPGRSAHDAVRQLREYLRQGYRIAVDIDLAKFFDTVNHDLLMTMVGRKVHDKGVLALIGRYLRAGVEVAGRLEKTRLGKE
jgi:RNA-directed DNA polymerase